MKKAKKIKEREARTEILDQIEIVKEEVKI